MNADELTPEMAAEMQATARARFDVMKRQQEQKDRQQFSVLDPKIRAAQRRRMRDANQFAWDVVLDPKVLLAALMKAAPQAVLLPVAAFMHSTTTLAREATGGRANVTQSTMIQTMWSAARLLRMGDVTGAVDFMMPIARLVTPGGTVEDIRKLLCNVIRNLYPCAPVTFTAPPGFVCPPPTVPAISMDPPQGE